LVPDPQLERIHVKGWVIGGTSGIGAACAEEMRKHMVVTSTGLRQGDWDVCEPLSRRFIADMGFPTHIVYSAGVNFLDWIGNGTYSHEQVVDVNLLGFLRLVDGLASCDFYKDRPWHSIGGIPSPIKPSIVAISSDAAERPLRTSIGYCASKAGLNMAVRVAARELGPKGWRINAVSPGMTNATGMQEYIDNRVPEVRGWTNSEALQYERSQEVTPERIHKNEVAEVVVQTLMGPVHLNGSIITLNGGR
jgi:NAD(P)-dependent dehydrogenase (short-subunit alcohol dehydrogenase family)